MEPGNAMIFDGAALLQSLQLFLQLTKTCRVMYCLCFFYSWNFIFCTPFWIAFIIHASNARLS